MCHLSTLASEDLTNKADNHIHEYRGCTTDELNQDFPQVTKCVIYNTDSVKLQYKKICTQWVVRILTEKQKKLYGYSSVVLEHYDTNGDEFLNHTVTEDETWIFYYTPDAKQQSKNLKNHGFSFLRQERCPLG